MLVILSYILCKVKIDDCLLFYKIDHSFSIAIPTNLEWSRKNLEERLTIKDNPESKYILGKPTIILLGEGATITKEEIVNIAKKGGMKLRSARIGHFSQVNGYTSDNERNEIIEMIQHFCIWLFKNEYTKSKLSLAS